MTDDPLHPATRRSGYVRGDWSFMVEDTDEEEKPEDNDDRPDDNSDD